MPVDWGIMGLILAMALAEPKPQDQTPPPDNASAHESAASSPEASLELLEFLGSWETATGQWTEAIPDTEASVPLPDLPKDPP